jgi:acylphosphatase
MNEEILYRIHVTGRVQGVGFRWNAAHQARSLGIKGFIKNLSDGSVYIEAEGNEKELDAFVAWCRSGPPFSSVENVEVIRADASGYTEFNIVH